MWFLIRPTIHASWYWFQRGFTAKITEEYKYEKSFKGEYLVCIPEKEVVSFWVNFVSPSVREAHHLHSFRFFFAKYTSLQIFKCGLLWLQLRSVPAHSQFFASLFFYNMARWSQWAHPHGLADVHIRLVSNPKLLICHDWSTIDQT